MPFELLLASGAVAMAGLVFSTGGTVGASVGLFSFLLLLQGNDK
jgi:hypothetical protein